MLSHIKKHCVFCQYLLNERGGVVSAVTGLFGTKIVRALHFPSVIQRQGVACSLTNSSPTDRAGNAVSCSAFVNVTRASCSLPSAAALLRAKLARSTLEKPSPPPQKSSNEPQCFPAGAQPHIDRTATVLLKRYRRNLSRKSWSVAIRQIN